MPQSMSQETSHLNFDLVNPDKNGGSLQSVRLAKGFEFVFASLPEDGSNGSTSPSAAGALANRIRLFGDPSLQGFQITEVSSGGSVPVLKAQNDSPFDVLLIAGQLVRGGKQNRGINADAFICSGKTAQLPVTCVEQGRWSGSSTSGFGFAGFEPMSVRGGKVRDVAKGMREGRGHAANQSQVWQEVRSIAEVLQAGNASSDLLHTLDEIKARIRRRPSGSGPTPSSGRSEPVTVDGESRASLDARIDHLRITARELAHRLERALRQDEPDFESQDVSNIRRELDHLLRALTQLQTRRARLAAEKADAAGGLAVSEEALAEANALAARSNGLLVFFEGEFVAGDLFADRSWFGTLYGELRDSAILSWDAAARRQRNGEEPRAVNAPESSPDATRRMAESVVRDALGGTWLDRPTPAHGRTFLLEHPFLESATVTDGEGTPLHVLLGTRHTPKSFRTTRGAIQPRPNPSPFRPIE